MVGNNLAFPLLDPQNRFRDPDLHVTAYLYLATQPPVILLLLSGKETCFSRKDTSTPFIDLCFAHTTGTTTSAGRWQEDVRSRQGIQQCISRWNDQFLIIDL